MIDYIVIYFSKNIVTSENNYLFKPKTQGMAKTLY